MNVINITTIIVSAALTAAFLELLKFLFSKTSSFWKDKTEEKKPLKKRMTFPSSEDKKNPYAEK